MIIRKPTLFGAVLGTAAIGLMAATVSAQSTGPISADAAKAAGAKTQSASSCVATCKARGNVQPQTNCAAVWCLPGKCYQNRYEAYCIK